MHEKMIVVLGKKQRLMQTYPNLAEAHMLGGLHPAVARVAELAYLNTFELRTLSHLFDFVDRVNGTPDDRLPQLYVDSAILLCHILAPAAYQPIREALQGPRTPGGIPIDLVNAVAACKFAGITLGTLNRHARAGRIRRYGAKFRYRYSLSEMMLPQPTSPELR